MIAFDRDRVAEVYCEADGAGDGRPSWGLGHVVGLLTEAEASVFARIPPRARFVNDPLLGQEGCQEILFGPAAQWGSSESAAGQAGLSPEREWLLFMRLNYARYRLVQARAGAGEALARAREMVAWHVRAAAAQEQIAQANLALVISAALRSRYSHVDLSDLVAEGNLALLRSIDSFDVSRGFRFSTYAFRCVVKSFHRLAQTARRQHRTGTVDLGAIGELAGPDDRRGRQEAIDSVREALHSRRNGLTGDERAVVIERFGLEGEGLCRSLRDVGTKMGLTCGRVRRLQKGALDKMRRLLGGEAALAR